MYLHISVSDLNVCVYLVQQVLNVKLILMNVIATHVVLVIVIIELVVMLVCAMKVLKAYIVKLILMNAKDLSMLNICIILNPL